jgi:hypothetical protein
MSNARPRRRFRRYDRGRGVLMRENPYTGSKMGIADGGHDAPATPLSPRGRVIGWGVVGVIVAVSTVALAFRFWL